MTMAMPAKLRRAAKALTYALLGALVFWTPNVVVHWIIAFHFSGYVVAGLTFLLPALPILFFGGLSQPEGWRFFVYGTLLFPVFTLVMSAYDGAFFALLLVTVLLPVLSNMR